MHHQGAYIPYNVGLSDWFLLLSPWYALEWTRST